MATKKTTSTAKATGTAAAKATTARKSPAKSAAGKTAAAKSTAAKAKTAATKTTAAKPKAAAKPKTAAKAGTAKTAAAKASAPKTAAAKAKAPAKTAAKAAPKTATKSRTAAKAPAKSAPAAKKAAAAEKKPAEKAPAKAAAKPAPKALKPEKLPFKVNDFVVYPTHGVGKITALEDQEVAGMHLSLFVIEFDKEKLTVRVPVNKAQATGMRQLASPDRMKTAMTTLKGRARIKRTMWSRRAQEYEAKINSGDPIAIAEVVRDLHRSEGQPEQSYSERQIYESAVERLSRELAAVEGLDDEAATEKLHTMLRAA